MNAISITFSVIGSIGTIACILYYIFNVKLNSDEQNKKETESHKKTTVILEELRIDIKELNKNSMEQFNQLRREQKEMTDKMNQQYIEQDRRLTKLETIVDSLDIQEKKKQLSDNLIEGKNNTANLTSLTEKDIKALLSIGE